MTAILIDIIRDEHNSDEEEELKSLPDGMDWPTVPRVGDIISLPSSRTVEVKTVFWNWPDGSVVVRVR